MISIVMATYNGEKFLREQIDSILTQTINDFELIIVDDNSSDKTVSIIDEYLEKDSRIKLYKNEKNIGFIKNFEKGLSLCNGDYIAFSDQDDIWYENHLEVLLNGIGNNLLICADSELYGDAGKIGLKMSDTLSSDYIPNKDVFFYLLYNNFVQGSTMLISSELKQIVETFPINYGFFHDHWLALYAAYYDRLVYLDTPVLLYRQHALTVTKNSKLNLLTYVKKVRKNNTYQDRLDCLQSFKLDLSKHNYNSLFEEAKKFYKNNRFYKIFHLIKNYKKIYAVNSRRYMFPRILKILLGVTK